jgi:hypothetical protein
VALPLGQTGAPAQGADRRGQHDHRHRGDLTLVWSDQAFAGSYGSATGATRCSCPRRWTGARRPGLRTRREAGAARGAVLMLVGFAPLDAVLGSEQPCW